MTIEIRPECSTDASAIDSVNCAAFGGEDEAKLVRRLRADGALVLSLLAEQGGIITGHVAFSRLIVDNGSGLSNAVSLAPLAVVPAMQGRGIGTALVRRGLADLAGQREALVFVLGEPAYYSRFGFDAAAAVPFSTDYAGPYFQLLRLSVEGTDAGVVRYPAAFAVLT